MPPLRVSNSLAVLLLVNLTNCKPKLLICCSLCLPGQLPFPILPWFDSRVNQSLRHAGKEDGEGGSHQVIQRYHEPEESHCDTS